MPGMTGMQLAAKIKEDPSLNHDILVVMLTGISNAPSKVIARNAGVKRILAKPVAGYTLKTTLAEELAQRGREQALPASPPGVPQALDLPADFAYWWPRTTAFRPGDTRHARQAEPATRHRQQW